LRLDIAFEFIFLKPFISKDAGHFEHFYEIQHHKEEKITLV